MCGSWSSSSWAEEEIALDGDNSRAAVWLAQGQWPNVSEKFWDDLADDWLALDSTMLAAEDARIGLSFVGQTHGHRV